VEFPNTPEKAQAGVLEYRVQNTSALIDRALETPKEILQISN
jgi:hypothetical protein